MYFLSVPKENIPNENRDLNLEMQRLMDTYGNDVLRTSYMYLKDKHKAEDAFQEVFLKVFHKYKSFKGDSSEKTWLIRVTINVCKDMLKSSWLKRVLLTDKISTQDDNLSMESRLIKKDENKLLFDEVISLPPVFKEVIILYYYHDYDTTEISKILNVAQGTVRSRLHRARGTLKQRMGGRLEYSE